MIEILQLILKLEIVISVLSLFFCLICYPMNYFYESTSYFDLVERYLAISIVAIIQVNWVIFVYIPFILPKKIAKRVVTELRS